MPESEGSGKSDIHLILTRGTAVEAGSYSAHGCRCFPLQYNNVPGTGIKHYGRS